MSLIPINSYSSPKSSSQTGKTATETDINSESADVVIYDISESSTTPYLPNTYTPSLTREEKTVFMKIARVVVFGIPIAWNTNDDLGLQKYFGEGIFSTYYEFHRYSPDIIRHLTTARKLCLKDIESYAYACDGWSTQRHAVSLEAFFINYFHRNKFSSTLLDVVPVESSTSDNIVTTINNICNLFGLDPDKPITTDGATNNISAFTNQRSICFAHGISTIISHIMSGTSLKGHFRNLKLLQNHFKSVNSICIQVKSKKKDFRKWAKVSSYINVDFSDIDDIPMPENFAATRWLSYSVQMQWLLEYGVLYDRFLWQTEKDYNSDLTFFLLHLQETSWIMFLLDNSLNLLARSDRPSLHLVIPVLHTIENILSSALDGKSKWITLTSSIARMFAEIVLFEIREGCLSLPQECMENCEIATAFFPEASSMVSQDILIRCVKTAEKRVDDLCNMKDSDYNPNDKWNKMNLLSQIIHDSGPEKSDNILVLALIPCQDKCILAGEKAMRIREYDDECRIERRKQDKTLSQLREELEKKKKSLSDFEEREEKLEKCKEVLEEKQCSGVTKKSLLQANRRRKEKKEKEKGKKEKRSEAMKRLNKARYKEDKEKDGVLITSQQMEMDMLGNRSEETKIPDSNNSDLNESQGAIDVQLQESMEFVDQAKKWKKNSEIVRKEISDLEDQIRRMEDLLHKLIEDLYAEVVKKKKQEETTMRNEMREFQVNAETCSVEEEIIDLCVEEKYRKQRRHDLPYGSEVLWDFSVVYQFFDTVKMKDNRSALEKVMDDVLSISATEAVCERLFRICSGIARHNYVTNINPSTVQTLTLIHYFQKAVIAMTKGEDIVSNL